ncbi:hypothetical protein PM082_002249 [Marasmius tenuissimus]|nr:hypothetical protein PM082_002249 [Marasmius tenuissimus]
MSMLSQLVAIALLLVTGTVAAFVVRARRRSLKFLPGPPSPSLLLGHEWDMSRKRVVGHLETAWFDQYGSALRLAGCFGEDILMLNDPRALQHVFQKSAYRYKKPGDVERFFTKVFGTGVLSANGGAHQRQRKVLNPAFAAGQIRPFAQLFSLSAKSLTLKWKNEIENGATVLDAVPWIHGMALEALGDTMLEYDFNGSRGHQTSELREILRDLFIDTRSPGEYQFLRSVSYRFLPRAVTSLFELKKTKEDKRFEHWVARSQAISRDLAKNKVESGGAGEKDNDFLSVVARSMGAEDPKKALNPAEGLSQMATIIFAGHETTAFTMNWVLYELSRNPKVQEKLFHEIKQVREQTRNDGELLAKDLEGMAYLNAVIRETLRFHPIIVELIREAEVDDIIPLEFPVVDSSGSVLREIPVTKGQRVLAGVYNYNRLKEVWGEDAEEWRPERFLNVTKPSTLGIFANLLTFGAGIRACIGWRFAVLEIQAVVAALVESFTFELPEGADFDQVRLSVSSPVVKGDWNAGSRLPLKVALRQA